MAMCGHVVPLMHSQPSMLDLGSHSAPSGALLHLQKGMAPRRGAHFIFGCSPLWGHFWDSPGLPWAARNRRHGAPKSLTWARSCGHVTIWSHGRTAICPAGHPMAILWPFNGHHRAIRWPWPRSSIHVRMKRSFDEDGWLREALVLLFNI